VSAVLGWNNFFFVRLDTCMAQCNVMFYELLLLRILAECDVSFNVNGVQP
jgi:hypothetical protein